jgi:hypothetical protein
MNGPVFLAWYNVRQGWLPEIFKLQPNWIEVFYFVNTYKYLTCGCTSFSSTNHQSQSSKQGSFDPGGWVAQCGPWNFRNLSSDAFTSDSVLVTGKTCRFIGRFWMILWQV